MTSITVAQRHAKRGILPVSIFMVIMLLLSACGADPQTQQQANSSKSDLDRLISQAQSIGVPGTMLKPIIQQEAALTHSSAPLTIFSGQPATDYYNNLALRYKLLAVQVRGMQTQVTQQFDYRAALDIQDLENALAQRQAQNFIEAKTFSKQLTQYQNQLAKAQYPKDYTQISYNAKQSTLALQLLGPAYDNLMALQKNIEQLQASHVDTTALSQQYQQDLQLFRNANKPEDFSQLIDQSTTQLQATADFSIQAIPYVGAAKLREFSADIIKLKQYGQNTTNYEHSLNADQTALAQARSITIKRSPAGAMPTSIMTPSTVEPTTWTTSMVLMAQGRTATRLYSMRNPPSSHRTTNLRLILLMEISCTCVRWRPITKTKRLITSLMQPIFS
ncbi:MAG: hypothetical protein E6J11_21495 [Chloroflexi bacterium]|nr:MAG: hypothetical protein E6J11_21495 [Chloroflexota bacterium]